MKRLGISLATIAAGASIAFAPAALAEESLVDATTCTYVKDGQQFTYLRHGTDQWVHDTRAGEDTPLTEVEKAHSAWINEQIRLNPGFCAEGPATSMPPTIEAGGMKWFLNKDGRTYVNDETRVTEAPTPAERESSHNLVVQHPEVLKTETPRPAPATPASTASTAAPVSTQLPESARGMGAQTGANSLTFALLAALGASIAGAAFAARRSR